MDGARRLGRNAMILSIVSILGGIAAIATAVALNWGCKLTSFSVFIGFKSVIWAEPKVWTRMSSAFLFLYGSALSVLFSPQFC